MAEKKIYYDYKKHREKAEGGRILISVLSTLVCIVLVAAFCSSSAKDSPESYSPPITLPEEETQYVGVPTEDIQTSLPPIPIDTSFMTDIPVIGDDVQTDDVQAYVTQAPVQTSPPVTSPPISVKPQDGERYIGGFDKDGMSLSITKVERGELNYFICDIKLSSPDQLMTAFAGGKLTGRLFTSKIASSVGASFAVNGDFCGFRTEGIIIRGGQLYRNDTKSDWDLLYLDANGDLLTCKNNQTDGQSLVSAGVLQSWCFGPVLVKDGVALSEFNTPNLSTRAKEPRTAIGQVDRLHYIILVVDQVRTPEESGGMSFAELASEFERLGCKIAYNLDGGGSTTLYYNGSVINTPCVNGERQVSDIIYLK